MTPRRAGPLLVLLLAARAAGQMGSLSSLDEEFTRVVREIAPAVVQVQPGISGVCLTDDGYVLTNRIVLEALEKTGSRTVKVTFPAQLAYDAVVHAADAETNTVILKIDARASLPCVRPGEPGELAVGHLLMTVGNAFGTATESEPAVTLGVVSSIRRDLQGRPAVIETSAATNPGQHGGPYFDTDGKLVGVFRALPDGQDLATVTPIDLIRAAYSSIPAATRIFSDPSKLRPPRSKAGVLSRAFHIAASRARQGVVTIAITRAPREEPAQAETAAEQEPERGDGGGEGRRNEGRKDKEREEAAVPAREGSVTGTIIDPRGFVLAPEPAFGADVSAIEVFLADGRSFRATVHARDRKSRLALLLLDRKPEDVLEVLGDVPQDALQVGQFAVAVAAPHGPPAEQEPFVTVGLLSGRHRLDAYRDALQTDAGVNVKNAGGVLVDLRGRMCGVILPPEMPFGQNSGLGFAMPVDALRAVLPRMMEGRDVEPAYIGVVLGDAPGGRAGVLVNEVTEGFPGAAAGLKPGDVITHLDGVLVANRRAFTDHLWKHKGPGDPLTVTVERLGEKLDLAVTLTRRPEE
ncbi:MAG: trypsin-like peptidase domain-containing protein [Planctomycetes bacterium]|nr:trypsin-like peptidase domain-containing protein [Planctomycetota bacterium]